MNAYEVKAGMLCLQYNNCLIHIPERLRGDSGELLTAHGRYIQIKLPFYFFVASSFYSDAVYIDGLDNRQTR